MLNDKSINVLLTYIKTPNINGFRQLVEQAIAEMNSQDIGLVECHISDIQEVSKNLVARGCQIILCTGATASYLQKKLDIEIQVIRNGTFDIIQAISNLKQYQRIALMGNTTSVNLENYADIFALDIQQFTYDSYLDAKKTVTAIKAQGFDAVIGSPITVELALNEKLVGQLAISLPSLKDLLQNALRTLDKIKREQHSILRLTEIFNHLDEGICVINPQKKISFINTAMGVLLNKTPTDVLYKPALEIFETLNFNLDQDNQHQIIQLPHAKLAVYISKLTNEEIRGYLLKVQELQALEHANSQFRKVSSKNFTTRYSFDKIATKNSLFQQTLTLAKAYATTDSTILITGESGTGKEVLAQSIHNHSRRSQSPFVAINCASFPESLLESELFGYDEGAFTGAKKSGRVGLIEAAHNGTLFLDEIGDMPLHLQTRFLRVLQERQISRLGSTTSRYLNIRVIAATHANLEDLVARQGFRADLYYRLNILRLVTPALRERPEDILYLAEIFLKKYRLSLNDLPNTLLKAMQSYPWAGNIRELENIIERISVLLQFQAGLVTSEFITHYLPELFQPPSLSMISLSPSALSFSHSPSPLKVAKRNQELDLIALTLQENQGDLELTAKKLGISRTTLWRRMKSLNVPTTPTE